MITFEENLTFKRFRVTSAWCIGVYEQRHAWHSAKHPLLSQCQDCRYVQCYKTDHSIFESNRLRMWHKFANALLHPLRLECDLLSPHFDNFHAVATDRRKYSQCMHRIFLFWRHNRSLQSCDNRMIVGFFGTVTVRHFLHLIIAFVRTGIESALAAIIETARRSHPGSCCYLRPK